jgi:hypothetical protein
VNHAETYLLVIAKRLEAKPIFATSVQQGYYSDVWGGGKPVTPLFSNPSQFARTGSLSPLKARVPSALKFPYRALRPWAITSVNELRDSAPFRDAFFRLIRGISTRCARHENYGKWGFCLRTWLRTEEMKPFYARS